MALEKRVGASCALAGVLLCAMLLSGAVSLSALPSPPAVTQSSWVLETVDTDYAGRPNSLALDSLNRPHIAYFGTTAGTSPLKIRYATRDGNGTWRAQTVEWSNLATDGVSIAVDSQDRPWISYPKVDANNTHWDLRLAHWNGTAWEIQTVEPPGVEAGEWPSLVLDRQDRPRIAYYSNVTGGFALAYAAWNGTAWTYQTVDANTGWSPSNLPGPHPISLSLDSLGRPRIAEGEALRLYSWDGTRWQGVGLAPGLDDYVSLAIDSQDRPHIAY